MKMKWLFLPVLLLLFSCGSTPETVLDPVAERAKAVEAMDLAKSVKADVAFAEEYNQAVSVLEAADAMVGTETGVVVAEQFVESEKLFRAVYEKAKIARDEALRQLNKARNDIKSVEADAEAMEQEQANEGAN